MYIHLGGSYSLPVSLIIGIFDIDETDIFNKNNSSSIFIKNEEDRLNIEWIDYEIPKSLILTLEKTYLSPVSAATLRQRCTEAFLYSNKMRARREIIDNEPRK